MAVVEPTFWQNLADRGATLFGGVRVRVLRAGDAPEAVFRGRVPGLPPERIRALVLELKPEGTGTVDIQVRKKGGFKVVTRGVLADGGLEQRLRNVLVNS